MSSTVFEESTCSCAALHIVSQGLQLQRFVDRELLFSWVRRRAPGIKYMLLEFDYWTRQYYQGAFSAVQASSSIAALLQIVRPQLEQLKITDSGYVTSPVMLQSLATVTQIQHLPLFGMSSHMMVSSALPAITCLTKLKNLELADGGDHRHAVQQQHPHFFPTQICQLPNLITLHVTCPLVSYIDAASSSLSSLQTLVIDSSMLEEVAPAIVTLPHLHTLCLSDNACLAAGKAPDEWWPDDLTKLTTLNKLNLSGCGISGVPVSLGRLAELSHLDLSANNSGPGITLPHEIGGCNSIRSLQMSDCRLDHMPDCLCRLTAMEYLNHANNKLNQLPQAISKLRKLDNLDLAHNLFTSFPTVLAGITNLARISFKGCTDLQIPEPLGMLSSLVKLSALIFTCDLTRHEPRWSADSTSNLISLALEFAIVHGRDTKILQL